jgi:hypothetical protein
MLVVSALLLLACGLNAQQESSGTATVPRLVRYSGVIAGEHGPKQLAVALYQESSGGDPLWGETQSVFLDENGRYTIYLGASQAEGLPAELFSTGQPRWLEVTVENQPPQARTRLISVPYALKAADAETVSGHAATEFITQAQLTSAARAMATEAATMGPAIPTALSGSGTANYLPLWTGASTLGNSAIYQGSAAPPLVGIATASPATTLDVNGASTLRGAVSLPPAGTATSAAAVNSPTLALGASVYSSSTKSAALQNYAWQAVGAGNNTASPAVNLNLLYSQGASALAPTGLSINSSGQIAFASGQNFPASGLQGAMAITNGGTGATTAAAARSNLAAAASGANADITSLSKLTTPLSVAQGGTGSSTQNFVDLSSTQVIGGSKSFSSPILGSIAGTASNASSLGNVAAANYARVDQGNSFTGNQKVTGNVTTTGSVGVGTATPQFALDLQIGSIRVTQQAGAPDLMLGNGGGADATRADIRLADTSSSPKTLFLWGGDTTNGFQMGKFKVNASSSIFSGKVGIGVPSPGQSLEVAGNVKVSGSGNGLIFPDGSTQTSAALASGGTISANSGSSDITISQSGTGNGLTATSVGGDAVHASGSNTGVYGESQNTVGILGFTYASGATNAGVKGLSKNSATGVYGRNTAGGYGVYGSSSSGTGVFGASDSGSAGSFQIQNTANNSPALQAATSGGGNALAVQTSGSSDAFYSWTSGGGNAILGNSTGTGPAGTFTINNPSNNSPALHAATSGGGNALSIQTSGSSDALYSWTSGGGNAILANTTGTGSAATFTVNNPSNNAPALAAATGGTGNAANFSVNNSSSTAPALAASTSGTGNAANFSVNNSSSTSPALAVTTNGYGSAASFAHNAGGSSTSVLSVTQNGWGNAGSFVNNDITSPSYTLYVYNYRPGGEAAYLYGDVSIVGNLNVSGAISKWSGSFKIDHPLDPANKYLYHSFVESPDMKNIYDGVVALDDNGEAWVTLPDWFEALNRDFRYQLTSIGAFMQLYVAEEISGNRFKIAGGLPGKKVSWQVTGIRQDAWANAHRVPVEEEKEGVERGAYLSPELFGEDKSMSVDEKHRQQAAH